MDEIEMQKNGGVLPEGSGSPQRGNKNVRSPSPTKKKYAGTGSKSPPKSRKGGQE